MKNKIKIKDEWIERLYGIINNVPEPTVNYHTNKTVKGIIKQSAIKSSSVSAALSIPGGIAGLASVIPDILAVWRIQAQMVSNIAAVHNKEPILSQEQMIWCMFRQMAVGMAKELVVQQGSKFLVQKANTRVMHKILEKVGHGIIKSQGSKIISKAVPLFGSVSAGALTYYDTYRVGKNADHMYSGEVLMLPPAEDSDKNKWLN